MRDLTKEEEHRLTALTARSVDVVLIEPTMTGLSKSILDATGPVRQYLVDHGLHDYQKQKTGSDHKRLIPCVLLTEDESIGSQASLYRPNTKKGDPRIWFRALNRICSANDILALVVQGGRLYVFNLTREGIVAILKTRRNGPLYEILSQVEAGAFEVAGELLDRLKEISGRGYIESIMDDNADTAVGRTLESLLGVDINSSRLPDYKGIEIKSSRAGVKHRAKTRTSLFAQVANWELSKFKSSREILDAFGYQRDADFKLYCTVSTRNRNPQGLQFYLDLDLKKLAENSDKPGIGDFAVWSMGTLHGRLLEKHNETFWVDATTRIERGREQFHFTQVLHTRKPLIGQFDVLLDQGKITMDHLIKRNARGRVTEKGPLFKINPKSIALLFPPSKKYELYTFQSG